METEKGKKRRIEETKEDQEIIKIEDDELMDEEDEDDDEEEVDILEYERKTKKKTEEIQVEFEAKVIDELDFKAIRQMIQHFCQKQTFNSIEMTELIISQPHIGAIIKESESTESFGFITVINLDQDKSSIKQIKKYVLASVPKDQESVWEKIIDAPRLGLIINERIRNVPHLIAPQLNESLFEDIIKGGQPFAFDNYLYITTFGKPDKSNEDEADQQKKKKIKSDRVYYKVEDEIYQKHSTLSATVPISATESRLII